MKTGSGLGRGAGMIGGLVVLAAAALLGGCNKAEKEELQSLQTENAELRSAQSGLQSENASLKQQMDSMRNQPQAQQQQPLSMNDDPGGGGGGGRPRGGGGGRDTSGGDGTIDRGRDSRGDYLRVAGDVLFDSGRATLKPTAKKTLDNVAKVIKNEYSGRSIRVEGFTDSDPIKKSKFGSNDALSMARAREVEKYLESKGVSGGRMSAVGRGSASPRGSKAESRRVEIVIVR